MKITTLLTIISFVSLISSDKVLAQDFSQDYRVEVYCNKPLQSVREKDLCTVKKGCAWKALSSSETATIWSKNNGEIVVREIPNRKLLRVSFKSGNEKLPMPWCLEVKSLYLKRFAKKKLKANKETQYIIGERENSQLKLLKSIDHPCRKLVIEDYSGPYKVYYLNPVDKKACKNK